MITARSIGRLQERKTLRQTEKVLLRHARARWIGSRRGLRRLVRRYVRSQRHDRDYLRSVLQSAAMAAAAALLALQMYAAPVEAATPSFIHQTGAANPLDGLDTGDISSPAFADLDGDGDLDMVSGSGYDAFGAFFYFENTGTAATPAFTQRTGAANPLDGFQGGFLSIPAFADLDDDGDFDMVGIGAGPGYTALLYFENTGTPQTPAFAPPQLIFGPPTGTPIPSNGIAGKRLNKPTDRPPWFMQQTAPTQPLEGSPTYIATGLALADLDGDGDFDITIGEQYTGQFFYFENTGTPQTPVFEPQTGSANPLDGFDVGYFSMPAFADLDGDGDLDMIGGGSSQYQSVGYGEFFYFENTGTTTDPAFTERTGPANPLDGVDGAYSIGPAFADLDGDGDYDMASGNIGPTGSGFFYFENTSASTQQRVFVQQTGAANPLDGYGVPGDSSPTFADLDGDGDLDMVSGEYHYGGGQYQPGGYSQFYYFENTGTPANPVFTERTGSANPLDGSGAPGLIIPAFADLDDDGDYDMVSTVSYFVYSQLLYFENTGTPQTPAFAPPEPLFGPPTDSPSRFMQKAGSVQPLEGGPSYLLSGLALADLDGDGDYDMAIGEYFTGQFAYLENTGTPQIPAFTEPGAPGPLDGLDVGGNFSSPAFTDIDGDGDLDMISGTTYLGEGTASGFVYFENTGTSQQPVFVLRGGSANPLDGFDVVAFNSPAFADLDGDGDSDVVSGNHTGTFSYFENTFRGDMDLDNRIAIMDVIRTVRVIIGSDPAPTPGTSAFKLADMNGDGSIDIADVVRQVNTILGIAPKILASGPTQPVTARLDGIQTLADGRMVAPVRLDADGALAGAQMTFTGDPDALSFGRPYLANPVEGVLIESHVIDGVLQVVVVNTRPGQVLPADQGLLLLVPVTVHEGVNDSPSMTLTNVLLADPQGQLVQVNLGTSTVQVKDATLPAAFTLSAARPNPFNPSTMIEYTVPQQAHITLTVYNLLGQEVIRLVEEAQAAGRYTVTWHGGNAQAQGVASGVYMYRLTSSTGFSETRRMTLVK